MLHWSSALDSVEASIEASQPLSRHLLAVTSHEDRLLLSPAEARGALYSRPVDETLAGAIWHELVRRAHEESASDERWRLIAVWMAIPALRRTGYRVSRRLGAERADVEAAMLLAFLEQLRVIDQDISQPGLTLLRAAGLAGWKVGRSAVGTSPVEDMEGVVSRLVRDGRAWQFEVPTGDERDLTAPLRVVVSQNGIASACAASIARWLPQERRPRRAQPVEGR
ncbi:hypothetical protein [Streptomyces specialis]|uniref:hypothetical protein n=1 Tax=Streptomyces specialis TaxID=498367 RepID=UPI00073E3676|nr:hypothetical protein [Streptomyces specialis]